MKRIVKAALPPAVRQALGQYLMERRSRHLARMPASEAFNQIYKRGFWKQGNSLSGPGSEGRWAHDYARAVQELAAKHNIRTAVDAGCGDFAVGALVAPHFSSYIGGDISSVIIERNRQAYASYENVDFVRLDITKDEIPPADMVMVRQVLQHLSNQQISAALDNLLQSKARLILIAEHNPADPSFVRNVDLQHHSVMTRVERGSGIDIRHPPFNLPAELLASLKPDERNMAGDSRLNLYLIDRSR